MKNWHFYIALEPGNYKFRNLLCAYLIEEFQCAVLIECRRQTIQEILACRD